MLFENEMYTELKDYPNYFIAISNKLVRKTKQGLKKCSQTQNSTRDPYWTVTVKTVQGNLVKRSMHRLLMETFVPNPFKKAHVNHKDGNKANNTIGNLEWATPKENAQHAVAGGLNTTDYCNKEVHRYFLSGVYIDSFKSHVEAELITGVARQNISKCTLGIRQHAGGYIWASKQYTHMPPVEDKIVSHFQVTDSNGEITKYKYLGKFIPNPNSKGVHPILKAMEIDNTYSINNFFIERIYYI